MTSSRIYLTSHPVYLTSRPLYLCNHTHSVSDISETFCMISHRVYMLQPIHYIYIISSMYENTTLCVVDTTLGICVTSFALRMLSHPLYQTKAQYLRFHIHFRHDISPTVSDIARTVSFSSKTLHWYHTHFCMTSYPLFMWHHMHSIEHHIISLCHHTTVLWDHSLYIWNHIQYVGTNIHYTFDITASNQCHHSRYIDNITHNLYDIILG